MPITFRLNLFHPISFRLDSNPSSYSDFQLLGSTVEKGDDNSLGFEVLSCKLFFQVSFVSVLLKSAFSLFITYMNFKDKTLDVDLIGSEILYRTSK